MATVDLLRCDTCGHESGSASTRPINAFVCPVCDGTMFREGHGPEYLWPDCE